MTEITWTHPSVRRLLDAAADHQSDPTAIVEERAREITLKAMEGGWSGPPYDPFVLAESLDIEVVAAQDLEDARLVSVDGNPRIEFNPQRRPARVRFSVAHEIGHFLFEDYGERIRYRDMSERSDDDWQLEMLCNIAAAEFLMPAGAFPRVRAEDLSLPHLLDLRAHFGVSTEALLRRVVRLTDRPACLFAAARLDSELFRIDYLVGSRAWRPHLNPGQLLKSNSVLNHCTAVGFSDSATEEWDDESVVVQVVGVPPYPGHRFPRLIGLLGPTEGADRRGSDIQYMRGDVTKIKRDAPAVISHVVNNEARQWGGYGVAAALSDAYPNAAEEYSAWASQGNNRLGEVHLAQVEDDLWIASLVAQAGYGDAPTKCPRVRLRALRAALKRLSEIVTPLGAGIHMPLIGTGQGGAEWPQVRDLILEELIDHGRDVSVYVLADAQMPEETTLDEQLTLA